MLNKILDRAPYINKIGMMCTYKNGICTLYIESSYELINISKAVSFF